MACLSSLLLKHIEIQWIYLVYKRKQYLSVFALIICGQKNQYFPIRRKFFFAMHSQKYRLFANHFSCELPAPNYALWGAPCGRYSILHLTLRTQRAWRTQQYHRLEQHFKTTSDPFLLANPHACFFTSWCSWCTYVEVICMVKKVVSRSKDWLCREQRQCSVFLTWMCDDWQDCFMLLHRLQDPVLWLEHVSFCVISALSLDVRIMYKTPRPALVG